MYDRWHVNGGGMGCGVVQEVERTTKKYLHDCDFLCQTSVRIELSFLFNIPTFKENHLLFSPRGRKLQITVIYTSHPQLPPPPKCPTS